MIAIIRITGKVKIKKEVEETLTRLRVRRKYACVLMHENKVESGMLKKVKDYVAFGEIDKSILVRLIEKRAKKEKGKEGKIDAEKIAEELEKGKELQELGINPFFRLHPPRGGIKSKKQFPKGVLGDNKKEINKLIERML